MGTSRWFSHAGLPGRLLLLCVVSSPEQRLPNAAIAVVPAAKLRDYVLNPAHPQGGPKARVFAAVLSITREDWRYLRDQLLAGVQVASATPRGSTHWGDLYEVTIQVQGRNGRTAQVRSGWIIRRDDDRPHLTTAYIDLSTARPG